MGLFGSLIGLAAPRQPKAVLPDYPTYKEEVGKSLQIAKEYTPELEALESERRGFLTQQTNKQIEETMPWFKQFNLQLGQNLNAAERGELPSQDIERLKRGTAAANFGRATNFGGTFANYDYLRHLGLAAYGVEQGAANTAQNWASMVHNLYAPAYNVDYTSKYLPSSGQLAAYDVSRTLTMNALINQKRQFDYATDPWTQVWKDVESLGDTVGMGLSAYLGGLGGLGGMAGGMAGLGSGGGGASAAQFLGGLYTPGAMRDDGTRAPGTWFGGAFGRPSNPNPSANNFQWGNTNPGWDY